MTGGALLLGLLAAIGYLLGSIPFGLLLTRAAGLGDIRKVGSGNIGATNVLRTGRKGLAAATVLLDAGKGAVAVVIALRAGSEAGVALAGFFAVIGHMFPVWLGFKGGKGVATGFGVLIAAAPVAALLAALAWIVTVAALRISSAAALLASVLAPILVAATGYGLPRALMAVAIAAFVWQRHRGNIARLIAGTEPQIGQKK
ncbi:MAG: glycerol-3-phosphate acyltransferase [Rhodospirillales bacterium 70-18]|nr:glycerol-3-phosphate 1-O-acyltransferase PlsY [Rhodospirillales bacterium]OJY64166.1 MAG: glycerol-3-phosphate acyltransferase [Rhodospirillales bacterium 70-18]